MFRYVGVRRYKRYPAYLRYLQMLSTFLPNQVKLKKIACHGALYCPVPFNICQLKITSITKIVLLYWHSGATNASCATILHFESLQLVNISNFPNLNLPENLRMKNEVMPFVGSC